MLKVKKILSMFTLLLTIHGCSSSLNKEDRKLLTDAQIAAEEAKFTSEQALKACLK